MELLIGYFPQVIAFGIRFHIVLSLIHMNSWLHIAEDLVAFEESCITADFMPVSNDETSQAYAASIQGLGPTTNLSVSSMICSKCKDYQSRSANQTQGFNALRNSCQQAGDSDRLQASASTGYIQTAIRSNRSSLSSVCKSSSIISSIVRMPTTLDADSERSGESTCILRKSLP